MTRVNGTRGANDIGTHCCVEIIANIETLDVKLIRRTIADKYRRFSGLHANTLALQAIGVVVRNCNYSYTEIVYWFPPWRSQDTFAYLPKRNERVLAG